MRNYDKYELYFETTGKGIEVSFTHTLEKDDIELLIEDIEAGETTFNTGGFYGVRFKAEDGVYWEVRNSSLDTVIEWDEGEITVNKENL